MEADAFSAEEMEKLFTCISSPYRNHEGKRDKKDRDIKQEDNQDWSDK